jgi:hypothetical protein
MSAPIHVKVGWALWGKQPGSNNDYAVLASSAEPLSPPEFGGILAHFAPGTPPTENDLPSSLPWVVISRVGIENKLYVGMAIQESTSDVDGTGRPITKTSYFCLPYAELADPGVSYRDLYRELRAIRLPAAGDGLIALSVPRLDPQAIAAAISAQKWELPVSATAAMLLDGPVDIVGSEGSDVADRLQYLDAVAAMLPFGYRADFTAATWSDSGAQHQIRLAFAARAREDAASVRWQSDSAVPAAGGPGSTYYRMLRQTRERRTGGEQLALLISAFAADTAESSFGQPEAAISSLRGFDLTFLVLTAVLDGTAQPAEIRAVFTQSRLAELGMRERQTLLGALIELGDPRDIPAVRTWWDTAAGGDHTAMLPALSRTCRRLVWTPAPALAVKDYLDLAASYGLLDAVLADLVVPPDTAAELNGGLGAAAQLLADRVLAGRVRGASWTDFPLTRRSMAGNYLVAGELLAQKAGSEQETRTALAWLEPVMHDFLIPFLVVLGDASGAVDRVQVGQLAHYNVNCLRALLQAASYGGRLQLVLPGFTSWLALSNRDRSAEMKQYWYEQAWALTITDPGSQAWLDLALLVLGYDPRFMLAGGYAPALRQYGDYFATAWSELAGDTGQVVDDQLTETLVAYLKAKPWTSDATEADTVVSITEKLTGNGRRERLESAVADALLASQEAARRESARLWLLRVRPRLDTEVGDVLQLLRQPGSGLTLEDRAEVCARGFRERIDPHDMCRALAQSAVIASGYAAMKLLEQVRIELYRVPAEKRDPYEWLKLFARCFADGATFSPELTEEFRKEAVICAHYDFVFRLDMLYIATTGGRSDSPPKLSEEDMARLEWIPKCVEQILKEARKRPGRLNFRGGKRERDKEGGDDHGPADAEQDAGTGGLLSLPGSAA